MELKKKFILVQKVLKVVLVNFHIQIAIDIAILYQIKDVLIQLFRSFCEVLPWFS